MLTVALFYNAVSPSVSLTQPCCAPSLFCSTGTLTVLCHKAGFSANTFFQYTIGLIVIAVFTLAYKIIMRTKWQNPATVDLVTGRHVLSAEELQMLDAYYQRPAWRRAATYVSLW